VMALADALHGLLRLPGATYSCVVERDTGRVLAETGRGEGGAGDGEGVVPYSVARWGTAVAAMFDATSGDELDDVMITGRRSYHLLRALGPSASVLVYLRLERTRSNLAAARRELAGVRWGGGAAAAPPTPTAPASLRRAGPRAAADASRAAAQARAERTVPSPGGPGGAAEPRRSHGPDAPAAGPAPSGSTRIPAALPPPGTPARGIPARGAGDGATSVSRAPTPARPSSGPAASRAAPPPEPADTTPRIPLPRRAPGQRSSLQGPSGPAPGSSPQSLADGVSRRRSAGRGAGAAAAPADSTPVPEGFAMPAVLGQSWARDPGTLRRLLAGLRRMS
jgi:hypothetical protein